MTLSGMFSLAQSLKAVNEIFMNALYLCVDFCRFPPFPAESTGVCYKFRRNEREWAGQLCARRRRGLWTLNVISLPT